MSKLELSISNGEIIHSECFVDSWIKFKISLQILYVVYIDKQMVIYKYKLVISPPVKQYTFIHPAEISFILVGCLCRPFWEAFLSLKNPVFRLQSDIWMTIEKIFSLNFHLCSGSCILGDMWYNHQNFKVFLEILNVVLKINKSFIQNIFFWLLNKKTNLQYTEICVSSK